MQNMLTEYELRLASEHYGYPVVGLTSPEVQYFLWRSYRKMARSLRLFRKKLQKQLRRKVKPIGGPVQTSVGSKIQLRVN